MLLSEIDYLEAGEGPTTVLVHSSVSGARQWSKLMTALSPSCRVLAVNLWGYGTTPPWKSEKQQTLQAQSELVEALISDASTPINLVGHSFGGSVAIKAAIRLGDRVKNLVLLEPNPFGLLRDNGRSDAFSEACALRDVIKSQGAKSEWMVAAEHFANYWGGDGTWDQTPANRREKFANALKPNFHEWDAIIGEELDLAKLSDLLPKRTLVVYDPKTVRPIREIVELLRKATPWQFEPISQGGHMAPLTHPDVINPIVERFLNDQKSQ